MLMIVDFSIELRSYDAMLMLSNNSLEWCRIIEQRQICGASIYIIESVTFAHFNIDNTRTWKGILETFGQCAHGDPSTKLVERKFSHQIREREKNIYLRSEIWKRKKKEREKERKEKKRKEKKESKHFLFLLFFFCCVLFSLMLSLLRGHKWHGRRADWRLAEREGRKRYTAIKIKFSLHVGRFRYDELSFSVGFV